MQVYLVGGAVRDRELNIPSVERDWCVTGASPQEMVDGGYRPVGKDFPVFLHPETHEEYALARTERKTVAGYHGFEFNTSPDITIEEDLERRDLTINAMARDANDRLIDPFGGLQDIKARQLRHVSDAFLEDPVRILRVAKFAARFHALGFTVAPATMELMQAMVANGEVDALVPDRVWKETEAALSGSNARVFFETLREAGALAVLFPEVDALFGVPQVREWHPEIDTGLHTMLVLDQAEQLSSDLDVRFAALVHDLGKGSTRASDLPSHPGHEKRGVRLVEQLSQRLPVPKACRDLGRFVAEYHLHCHRAFELRPETILKLLEAADVFRRPERFAKFLLCCEADARGRTGLEDRDYPQTDYLAALQRAALDVNAGEIAKQHTGAGIPEAIRRARLRALRVESAALKAARPV